MRKRDKVTYLVRLEVGAIEDHMSRAAAGGGPAGEEPTHGGRALQVARDRGRGGMTR
ncbi:MAG: hypothetical protein ACREQM_05650 [Candidatus Dormibacteraceae bacterium]